MSAASTGKRLSYEQELAPHVERKWAEKFITELRLQRVSGEDLGAALTEVDSHCADAQDSAQEIFGDPKTYAESLRLPEGPGNGPSSIARGVAPTVVQITGFIAIILATPTFVSGDPVVITAGDVVNWGILGAVIAVLIWWVRPVLPSVMRHPVSACLGFAIILAGMAVPLFVFQQPVFELPAGGVMLVGAILLGVGTVWAWASTRVLVTQTEIARPFDEAEDITRRSRPRRRMEHLRIFMFPVIGGVLIAVVLLRSVLG